MAYQTFNAAFKEFAEKVFAEKGKLCWFCGTDKNVFCCYLLSYKKHKQDRLFNHPDKAIFYYPSCQTCLQTLARNRDKFAHNLVVEGISALQVEQYLANEIKNFLAKFNKYDVTAFKSFCRELGTSKENVKYVPNYDENPIVQLLPTVASKLQASEIDFVINRIKQYQEDFMFNNSSDYILLLNVVLDEVHLQRMQAQLLAARPGSKEASELKKEFATMNKDYKDTITALGIMRKDRDKIAGATIAEISTLIGDENEARLEIQEWDNEMIEKLNEKAERDKKSGLYD